MPALYEISQNFAELFDRFDSINEYEFEKDETGQYVDDDGEIVDPEKLRTEWLEAWYDTLSSIEMEFDEKAENIAVYIKNLLSAAEDKKDETKKLIKRAKADERKAENLKKYLLDNMQRIGVNKIDRPKACMSVRKNPVSVKIADEDKFIDMLQANGRDDLLRYSKPQINKTEIKSLLKSGEVFDGAILEAGFLMTIK